MSCSIRGSHDLSFKPQESEIFIDSETYDKKVAKDVYATCAILFTKESYFVDEAGKLQGYNWLNFPMRIALAIRNWISNGKIESDVAKKVQEAFDFVLSINDHKGLDTDDSGHKKLGNMDLTYCRKSLLTFSPYFSLGRRISTETLTTYRELAKKVIRKFPQDKYPELFKTAAALFHKTIKIQ